MNDEQNKSISELEDETFETDDSAEVPPNDIVAYNELRSCADLFRMFERGILDISPEFQRDKVWKPADQTRFIDSAVKNLPIPSMCFALDFKRDKWIVIDGLQRISTIIRFLEGGDWKLSKLDDIDQNIAGKSVSAMKLSNSPLHKYYMRVENLAIPVTVLRCDFSKETHMEYLFTIFHRLNTGGMKLNNQEIRNCIYSGPFNRLLHELDDNNEWRRLNKMSKGDKYRYKKQEITLRMFALGERYENYTGSLAKFLNDYMHENRYLSDQEISRKREIFERTVTQIYSKLFGKKPPKLSITIMEALLIAVYRNIEHVEQLSGQDLFEKYSLLINSDSFSDEKLLEGLSGRARVIDRLATAENIFSA